MKRAICRLGFVVIVALLAAGCNQVELFSNLEEQEVNEMQAILLRQGIDCDKIMGKEQICGLMVDKNNLAAAVEILKGHGHPRDKFTDMGQMFKKEGLVSSPQEDRIRFIYALSQEVAKTISKIEGIVDARVHIVLPENDPLSEYFQPSSASVFIKYRQSMEIQRLIHPIKQLVVNSIEGLTYEKVSIVQFPCTTFSAAPRQFVRIMGIEINAAYAARFKLLVMGLVFFLTFLMISNGYLLWRRFGGDPAEKSETPGEEAGDVLAV